MKFNIPPCENYPNGGEFELANVPTDRATADSLAIPRCREWREAHPEACTPTCRHPETCENIDTPIGGHPAPYCCSAYCLRCAILRALDGVDPLRPNEWMWTA